MTDERPPQGLMVGSDVLIHGVVETQGEARVFGTIQGELKGKEVLIARGGRVEGRLEATNVDLSGYAGEQVKVHQKLKVRANGELKGRIEFDDIEVEGGARISGNLVNTRSVRNA